MTNAQKQLSNVWKIFNQGGRENKLNYEHPARFPEELARRHIYTWTNPGDLILDPFIGSGTTAVAAQKLGRHYIGGDISLEYVELARQRVQNADPFQASVVADKFVQHSLFEKVEVS